MWGAVSLDSCAVLAAQCSCAAAPVTKGLRMTTRLRALALALIVSLGVTGAIVTPAAAAGSTVKVSISAGSCSSAGGRATFSVRGDATPDAKSAQLQVQYSTMTTWITGPKISAVGKFAATYYDIANAGIYRVRWVAYLGTPASYSPTILVYC